MKLSMRSEEAILLKQILERFLSNLRMEIADTESYDLRQELKRVEETVKALISRLKEAGVA
ncbi:MAG: hypothetical protein A2Z17_04430 [Gammaproteobacteria bacterium RBG_16_66_13]|nr:MAG: hypothetical protein A2Z17_04430 [Gammaproteobacteria bacterium RBG_16_66_13]